MGLGSLATIGVKQPRNLSIVVLDNRRYGETGMQASHTQFGIDLAGIARGCRFAAARDRFKRSPNWTRRIAPVAATGACIRSGHGRPKPCRACCRARDGNEIKFALHAGGGEIAAIDMSIEHDGKNHRWPRDRARSPRRHRRARRGCWQIARYHAGSDHDPGRRRSGLRRLCPQQGARLRRCRHQLRSRAPARR